MHVIGHEAVRQDCESLPARDAQKLRQDQLHCGGVLKPFTLPVRAKGQGIALKAKVGQMLEPCRSVCAHAVRVAMGVPVSSSTKVEPYRSSTKVEPYRN